MKLIRNLMGRLDPAPPAIICLLAMGGAVLSPAFASQDFAMWSLSHAVGAALTAGLLWTGAALLYDVAVKTEAIPVRIRRNGAVAALCAGAAVALAVLGGLASQTGVTEVGRFTAGALGALAAAMVQVRHFATADEDRRQGNFTLPARLGWGPAIAVNMATVAVAYGLALFLLIQYVGMQKPVILLMSTSLAANLLLLGNLAGQQAPAAARKAVRHVTILFVTVTFIYVGTQALAT